MNNLSFFIYLSDVIANVSGVLLLLGFILFFVFGIDHIVSKLDGKKFLPLYPFFIGLALILVCTLAPSRDTIYLVLASEFGEDVYEVIKLELESLKGTTP